MGHHKPLPSQLKKLAAASVLFAASAAFAWSTFPGTTTAAGDTRTLSLYHVHTKESLTITYKKDGRYVPSALDKINYLMRDWRRNEVMKIDPKTLDLMWELHADLDSKAPIHVICGYRSANTNAMLKRIGRNVAKQSMHIRGKAIDLYFPDVSVAKLRGSAMARQIGGVGYYPKSGASGFVHIDSGNVRYWPRPSAAQVAQIMSTYKKTIGARMSNGYMLAQVQTGPSAEIKKVSGKVQMAAADFVDDEGSEAAPQPKADIANGYPVPKPRAKPIEVLMLAAARMQIEPASAPAPKNNFARRPSPAADEIGMLAAVDDPFESDYSFSNISTKGSFAAHASHEQADLVTASTSSVTTGADDFFWWPTRWLFNTDSIVRTDSTPKPIEISYSNEPIEPEAVPEEEPASALSQLLAALHFGGSSAPEVQTSGKADSLFVNREQKSDFAPARLGDAGPTAGAAPAIIIQ